MERPLSDVSKGIFEGAARFQIIEPFLEPQLYFIVGPEIARTDHVLRVVVSNDISVKSLLGFNRSTFGNS